MNGKAILIIALAASLSACGGADQDRLTDEQATVASVGADPLANEDAGADNLNDMNAAAEVPLAEQPEPAAGPTPEAAAASEGPSYSCEGLLSQVEQMVCDDPQLAALDRRAASKYERATAVATSDQRDRLRQADGEFLTDRNSCDDATCVRNAYRDFLLGIDGVMTNRGQKTTR